ncbi:MAG: InlB B-repeat-containing protein [Clostridia bacterium]|nr:InlB B-repeat-containing protein [Clostridia bacterium]
MNNLKAKRMFMIILVAIVAVIVLAAIVTICFADEGTISIFSAKGSANSSLTTFEGSNDLVEDEWEDYDFRIIYVNCDDADNSSNYQYIKNLGDEEVITLNNPSRTNTQSARYSFVGWYLDADFSAQITQIDKKSFNTTVDGKNAVRVYAKWNVISAYTVVYNVGSGVNDSRNPSSIWEDDPEFELYDPTSPIDNGSTYFNFEGWYTQANGGGEQVVNLHTNLPKDNQNRIVLYANYEEISYIKITLVLNGNSSTNSDVTVTSTKYTIIRPDSETTYNAYARRLSSSGTFDVSDITATKSNLYDSNNNLLATYTFGGWYVTASCTGNALTTIYTESYGVTTLYAKWNETRVGYNISYVLNNGTNDNRNVTYMSSSTSTTLYPATRAAANYITYTFNGWYTYYDGSESAENGGWSSSYLVAGSTSAVSFTPTSDTTLYAKWTETINSFTITYHIDTSAGEANNSNNPSTHSNDIILVAPTKAAVVVGGVETKRFQFAGWYDNSNLTGNPITLVKAQNIEVWPKWIEYNVYQVNYHLTEAEAYEVENKNNPTTYSVADGAVVLYEPAKDSYDSRIIFNFKGWYVGAQAAAGNFSNDYLITQLDENIESSANVLSSTYDPDGNGIIDLYTNWEEKPDTFIITYHFGAGEANNPKNPTYTSTLNNARTLFAPTKVSWMATATYYIATAYEFIGWYDNQELTGTPVTIVYFTDGAVDLYPKWAAESHTTYVSKTGGAVRVNEYLKTSSTGDYMLYGAYYQTEVGSAASEYFDYAIIDGKYYRKEPILWRIVNVNGNTYTLHSDVVLDQSVYDADSTVYENSDIDTFLTSTFVTEVFTGFSDVRQSVTVSEISRKVYVPLYSELGGFSELYLMKCASDYALARGVTKDDKMGTSAYWVRDTKTDAGLTDENVPTVKYVGQRGYLSYNLSSASYVGVAPMIQVTWTSNP